nr:MAG TPA: bromodomain protein [Caudoviricetes sp.]
MYCVSEAIHHSTGSDIAPQRVIIHLLEVVS